LLLLGLCAACPAFERFTLALQALVPLLLFLLALLRSLSALESVLKAKFVFFELEVAAPLPSPGKRDNSGTDRGCRSQRRRYLGDHLKTGHT
jgi:hypothetical protein